jgi:hypothetical protein
LLPLLQPAWQAISAVLLRPPSAGGEAAKALPRHQPRSDLDAHLAEAIPLDLLKNKQDHITAELAAVEGRMVALAADFKKAETNLHLAISLVGDCEAAYR